MGIHHDLNVIRNYRKSLLHLTMLTSIVAAAAATATIEPALTNSMLSPPSQTSSSSPQPHKESVPVAKPLPPEPENDSRNQIVFKNRPAIPYCDDSDERTIGRSFG